MPQDTRVIRAVQNAPEEERMSVNLAMCLVAMLAAGSAQAASQASSTDADQDCPVRPVRLMIVPHGEMV